MPQDIPQRGDIFWAHLPLIESEGSEQNKDRPVLVISVNSLNSRLPIVVIVPLSSEIHKISQHRIRIPESQKIQEPGTKGCPNVGLALTEQIRCISRNRLGDKRLARITPAAMAAVEAGIAYILEIPNV